MSYEQIAVWSQVISAPLFLFVLLWVWVKWISPAVLTAQEAHNAQVAQAERHRDEAKAALDALHQEIAGAVHDAELIAKRASDQAARERDATLAQARDAGERALRNAQGELERARAEARAALRTELLEKALAAAEREAVERVDGALNVRIVDHFVASLEPERVHG